MSLTSIKTSVQTPPTERRSVLNEARAVLPVVLGNVEQELQEVDDSPLDVEQIHDLRVATRRAVAAVELFSPLLPQRPAKWLRGQLRNIRRAAAKARDLDVLHERHGKRKRCRLLRREIACRRRETLGPLQAVVRELLVGGRFQSETRQLVAALKSSPGQAANECFSWWAVRRIKKQLPKFFRTADRVRRKPRPRRLHTFRIRVKRLRYAIELLPPAETDQVTPNPAYRTLVKLQEKLGSLHDYAAARGMLRDWRAAASCPVRRSRYREHLNRERRKMAVGIDDFSRWWTKKRIARLRRGLRQLLKQCAAL